MKNLEKTEIANIFSTSSWESLLETNLAPAQIVELFDFKTSMQFAGSLIRSKWRDDSLQEYAIDLMRHIQKQYPTEWDADWKNDAYLGTRCSYTFKWEESYKWYKRAYDKLKDPPASLILVLLRCTSAPNVCLITSQEEEILANKALEKELTADTAMLMRSVYSRKGDEKQKTHWDKIWKQLEAEGIHTALIIPDVLKNFYSTTYGFKYEV